MYLAGGGAAVDIDIPPPWERSAADIIRHRWRIVLIVGAVDRGKSTYCQFLSQRLLAAGFRVAVVDADVGQKNIGPPATITLGYPEAAQRLVEVPPIALYFVGAVSPVGHLLPMVVGTQQLVERAQTPFVLVNTTGLVHGVGQVLKSYKIEALRPQLIVALELGRELQPLLKAYRNYRVLRLQPSTRARIKTSEDRRLAREHAFQRYFQTATEVALPVNTLLFQRRPMPSGFDRYLLCGVADRRNRGLGLAIITGVDWHHNAVKVLTPVPPEHIHILQGGDLYLSATGGELGHGV
jgi:polynucleotide 5'-hydroxyl-kinase GRC3/NOL9